MKFRFRYILDTFSYKRLKKYKRCNYLRHGASILKMSRELSQYKQYRPSRARTEAVCTHNLIIVLTPITDTKGKKSAIIF